MEGRGEGSMWKRRAVIILAMFAVTFMLVPVVQAADEIGFRAVYHSQKMETMEVGDVPGHVVGVIDQPGLVFVTKGPFAGEIGTRKGTTLIDSVKGKGTATTYLTYTFPDGSTQSIKATGTFAALEGGKGVVSEGTWEVTGGTGRFEGWKGKGTFKADRPGPPQPGSTSYADATGTLWK